MASEDEQHIRIYQFHTTGFIPGIPGEFSGGSLVKVDTETNQILAIGVIGQPFPEEQPETAPALQTDTTQSSVPESGQGSREDISPEETPGQGEALPVPESDALANALNVLGGNS